MIYSQSKHTNLYFLVPLKCGFSSFKKLHKENHLINGKENLLEITEKVQVDVFIIRNPYDRVISIFKNKFRQDIIYNKISFIQKLTMGIFKLTSHEQILNISFDQFLEKLPDLKKWDAHCLPLTSYYDYCINTPSYILEIGTDNESIEKLLGCKLPHENTTSSICDIMISNSNKEIIKDIYKEDFDFFYQHKYEY